MSSQDVENGSTFRKSSGSTDNKSAQEETNYHLVEEIDSRSRHSKLANEPNSEHNYNLDTENYTNDEELDNECAKHTFSKESESNPSSMSSQINLTNSDHQHSSKYSANRSKCSQIEDSLGELNHLMLTSSSSIGSSILPASNDESLVLKQALKQRKSSTSSFQMSQSMNVGPVSSPMFKPPSQLPPVENGEVIMLDIETYRFIMQDLQSTKAILYKVANMLREPSSECGVFDGQQSDEFQNTMISNPLISSLYSHVSGFKFTLVWTFETFFVLRCQ